MFLLMLIFLTVQPKIKKWRLLRELGAHTKALRIITCFDQICCKVTAEKGGRNLSPQQHANKTWLESLVDIFYLHHVEELDFCHLFIYEIN